MSMRKFRWLVVHLLAVTVLADAFAVDRGRRPKAASDTGQDLTPAASAAQHITKIPRTKTKAPNKTTAKPTETTTVVTKDTSKSATNEIEGEAPNSRKPSQDAMQLTAVASNGTDDATPNTNGTVQNDAPVESTPVSVTNNETKGNKEAEVVTEVSGNLTNSSTVSLTTLDSETHYSTASVKGNVDEEAITSTTDSIEPPLLRGEYMSGNVSESNNSVNALVAEYTKANTISEAPPELPFKPYSKPISEDREKSIIRGGGSFEDEPTTYSQKIKQTDEATLEPRKDISTISSKDNKIQPRSDDVQDGIVYLSELTTLKSSEAGNTKYSKVISKEERQSASNATNYGDKLDIEPKSPTDKENEGPLDDVTMETSNSWRREDSAVVTSMRGGYLNHSPDVKKVAPIESDFGQPDEDNETKPKKSTQSISSQSLMVDDEGLLTEEKLLDNELARAQLSSAERPLSVKPIGKNNTLYAPNPNYKPMKKMDVVPGKPFLRDPDDNSWRNESLNNLGIVFKGKNSTKSFTQVLKNKTGTELGNGTDKDNKTETPELRERLEKLAEERKSKKKKTDKSGEVGDYEDIDYVDKTKSHRGYTGTRLSSKVQASADRTSPFKNSFNTFDYDTPDDDVEYVTLPYLDIQKSPTTKGPSHVTTRLPTTRNWAKPPTTRQHPDRKPTIQYFPPRAPAETTKVYMRNSTEEDDFYRKMQAFVPEHDAPVSTANLVLKDRHTTPVRTNFYLADTPKPQFQVPVDKGYSFRDIMTRINQEDDYDKLNEYVPIHRVKDVLTQRDTTPVRQEVIEKFMQNYNDNSRKFNVDYPVVYKSRVVHTDGSEELPASSSASMKQQYSKLNSKQVLEDRMYDPNCEKTVELTADYELHYYLPEQEEKLEIGKMIK